MTKEQIEAKAREIASKYVKLGFKNRYNHERYEAAMEMAEWLLSNQWVSVEEELPPFEENVLVKIKWENLISDAIRHRTNNPEVYVEKNKFAIYDDEVVTHWMPIPPMAEKG